MSPCAGAALSGFYSVQLKAAVGTESRLDSLVFFFFLGIVNAVVFAPVLGIWSLARIEPFESPGARSLIMLTLNGILATVVADALWMIAVLMTGPVLGELAISLTIVIAMVTEVVWFGGAFSVLYYLGCVCVTAGFVLSTLSG